MTDEEARDAAAASVFPVRGLMAVYVFTTGLYGAVTLCGDERRGLFCPFRKDWRRLPLRQPGGAGGAAAISAWRPCGSPGAGAER